MEVIMAKDWFDKHIVVMTLDDDKLKLQLKKL
jgi:hypothetical protein